MTTPVEMAAGVFSQGYSCSQSVFSAFAEELGLKQETALKIASPFGGGVARGGELCGAVSGALLALGLARGAAKPAGKDEIYRLSQELMRRFEQKHSSSHCRDLIGCDIRTPEGYGAAAQKGVFKTICPLLVQDAVELAQSLIEEG